MDESEFEEELYDVASPCDIPSDAEDHNNLDFQGYESDSSGLFVAEHVQPLDDFIDADEDGLDFDPANYLDFSDDDLELALGQADDEYLSDVLSVYSPQPDLEDLLRDFENEEAPASPARLASESPAGSDYDLDSEIDVEELLEAALNRERQFQGLVEENRRIFNPELAIQGYSPVQIESDDDSDIQAVNPHSPASDDLFILATPSVASGSASTATSQSSASSAPHRASRLDQAGPSRRPIEPPNPPQNNNNQNHNFRPAYRIQDRVPAYRPYFPAAGAAPTRASPRPRVPFHPPVWNHSNDAPHRRHRREPSILLGDDEPEDELIMMEYGRPRRVHQPPPPPPPRGNNIIDLTLEPDSPVQAFALPPRPAPQGNQSRANPRRSNSLNHRAPSLNRSDGSNLPGRSFIDLTDDSPEPYRPQIPHHPQAAGFGVPAMSQARANNNPPAPADDDVSIIGAIHRFGLGRFNFPAIPNAVGGLLPGLFGEPPAAAAAANQNDHRHRQALPAPRHAPRHAPPVGVGINGIHNAVMAVMAGHPLHNNPIGLDYRPNGFHGIPHYPIAQPKPDFVPPKPAREGFTRDTGSDDQVPVCASCEEELQYDADEGGEPAPKKARTRKDREEHHFWALVDCGHVYCKRCYENRKPPSSKSSSRRPGSRDSNRDSSNLNFRQGASAKHILCAVGECETEASHKKAWVGLFL